MAKKKEDLGGVWRTVGGRRIFIKDGQDLYEAMNDSGKFTNLKRENFKRKEKFESKSLKEQVNEMKEFMNNYKGEKLYEDFAKKTGIDVDRAVELYQDAESHGDLEIPNELQSKSAYAIKGNEWQDIPGFKDFEYNQEKDEVRLKSEFGYIDKRNKEIEFERDKGIYTGARETNPDGSYKHQKEFENKKIDDFVKNNPDWEIGRYDEEEYDDLADTLGVNRNKVAEEIYDRIREKNVSDRKEMFERIKKDFIKKTDEREAEFNSKPKEEKTDKYVIFQRGGMMGDRYELEEKVFNSKEEAQEALKSWKDSYGRNKSYYKPQGNIYKYKGKTPKEQRELESKPDYEKRPQSDVDRENDRNNKITQAIEKGQKDFDPVEFEKWRQEHDPEFNMSDDSARYAYEAHKNLERARGEQAKQQSEWDKKVAKQDKLLEKATKIEKIEKELKEVQSRVWNAEIDMSDQGIEENRWRENPGYNEDRYRLVYLRRDLEEAKDEYWKEKNKINQKRWEKELNSKPNTTQGRIVKDSKYYAWVDEVDPNSELTESELEQLYRSIYPNRYKK